MMTLLPIGLGLLLQSTVLLLLGLLALRLARRRGPAVQSLIGRATLAGVGLSLLLAGPLTGHIRPLWRVTIPTAQEPTPPRSSAPLPKGEGQELKPGHSGEAQGNLPYDEGAAREAREKGAASSAPTSRVLTSSPSRSGRVAAPGGGVGLLSPALAAAWGLGTALLLLWLGVCQLHLTRLRRCACPVTSGPAAEMLSALTPRPPALLSHPSVRSPFLAGLRHPAIFLPAAYEADFDAAALRAILAHELAHLARRDTAWTLACRLLCALLWPQPLLWVWCRRLEQISEEACDQAVLAHDCPARAYAACLLTLAERHPLGRRERALGAGVAPFRSSLGQRISRILDKGTYVMSTVTPRLRLTIAALTLVAALGGAFLVSPAPAHTIPVTQSAPSLIGAWRVPAFGSTKTEKAAIWIFRPDQYHYETINDIDGRCEYGTYITNGSLLKLFLTHIVYDNHSATEKSRVLRVGPIYTLLSFKLSGDRLTLQNALGETSSTKRLSAFEASQYKEAIPSAQLWADDQEAWSKRFSQAWIQRKRLTVGTVGSSNVAPNDSLSQARFLAGLTPVQGPGVLVTLNDSKKRLPTMPAGVAPPNIIHDSDINQVVNELKAAGAEAIAVNDQRLVATSSVRDAGPSIFINNTPTVLPFIIKAIGNPKTLATAINLPGGVAEQIRHFDAAMFSIREAGALRLPAYSGGSEPRYAKPISAASADTSRQRTTAADQSRPLILKRDQLKAQLHAYNEQDAALTAQNRIMHMQVQQAMKKLTPPPPRGTHSRNQIDPERQALARQLAAAQVELRLKEATLEPDNPAVIAAQRKVQSLEKAYREQPIREKFQFAKEVHQYIRGQVAAFSALAQADKATSRQLSSVREQQRQLKSSIAFLDAQIAQSNASARGH